ncbi:type II toxin-antitoxin system VapC family toxin [Parapedobacter sp. DT-150]|uniref:type II toxin-antitoxin system VapC family toxin n=1 Tax=Parapedobacter sp. DT-150 TaxID=3396162 RepID=UPI003F1A3B89
MQRLFIDTNIILDLLGERHPFYEAIAKLATLADKGKVTLFVSPISFTTVDYILSKFDTPKTAREKLRKFKVLAEVCDIGEAVIEKALNSSFTDFEDAVQYFCATASDCEIIITRDNKDFKQALIPVMTADAYLKSIIH